MKHALKFSILVWASKAQPPSTECSLYARVTFDGKRAEISLQKKVDSTRWDARTGRLKGNSSEVKELNNYLNQVQAKLYSIYNKLLNDEKFISVEAIKNEFYGRATVRRTLLLYMQNYNEDVKRRVGLDMAKPSYVKFRTLETKLQGYVTDYLKKKDIYLESLDYSFVKEFEFFLRSVEKINSNTTMKYIRMLKQVMNDAVRRNLLLKNPFAQFKCTFKWPEREVLNKEELNSLIQKEFTISRIAQVRDYFVFSCYTGLAYVDLINLSPSHLVIGPDGNRWLSFYRQKTKIAVKLPLLAQAKAIALNYIEHPESQMRGRIFPCISNQKMNSYLKEIGDLCGIRKPLTFHIARHTFATTVTLANGVPMESVSKMLGHTKITTTQIYSKVVMEKLSEDMEKLKLKLEKI